MFGRMGRERFRLLGVRSDDPVLSVVGPVGLASAAGTALLIDLGTRLGTTGARTLTDLVHDGPRLDELSPGRPGVAVIRRGTIEIETCVPLVEKLATRWPAVVVRVDQDGWPGPVVPVHPLYPGWLAPETSGPAVWQSFPWSTRPPGPGPVLPRLRTSEIRRMLGGGQPTSGRGFSTWQRVWELPWA